MKRTSDQESGIRDQESGIRNQESGVGNGQGRVPLSIAWAII
jgi:hypothetical protein